MINCYTGEEFAMKRNNIKYLKTIKFKKKLNFVYLKLKLKL